MQPDRYETSTAGRHRLEGVRQARRFRKGPGFLLSIVLGGLFAAAGAAAIGEASHLHASNPHGGVDPSWILRAFGVPFVMAGLLVWGARWATSATERLRLEMSRRHPGEPALADYPWHPGGFTVSKWKQAVRGIVVVLLFAAVLSVFNVGLVGRADAPWMIRGVVGFFDLLWVLVAVLVTRQVWGAFKFGHSRVRFTRFPYRTDEPLQTRWEPGRGIGQVKHGTFTLRCIEEWIVIEWVTTSSSDGTGSTREQREVVFHDELWSATWKIEQPRSLASGAELRFELPADATPTRLSVGGPAERSHFWELEVMLALPGLDFHETYLVPVYGSSPLARTGPSAQDDAPVERAERTAAPATLHDLIGLYLVTGVIVLTGAGLIYAGLLPLVHGLTTTNWPGVPGVVTQSVVGATPATRQGRGIPFADIQYTYEVNGHAHSAKRVSYGNYVGGDWASEHIREVLSQYPKGQAVTVYYNTANASEAVLQRGMHGASWVFLCIGAVVVCAGVGMWRFLRYLLARRGQSPAIR